MTKTDKLPSRIIHMGNILYIPERNEIHIEIPRWFCSTCLYDSESEHTIDNNKLMGIAMFVSISFLFPPTQNFIIWILDTSFCGYSFSFVFLLLCLVCSTAIWIIFRDICSRVVLCWHVLCFFTFEYKLMDTSISHIISVIWRAHRISISTFCLPLVDATEVRQ